MSADVIKDAERVIWWWETLYIATTGSYESPNYFRTKFVASIHAFRKAKVEGENTKVAAEALNVMNPYNLCIEDKLIGDTDKALNSYQWQKNENDRLKSANGDLKEQHSKEIADWQKKYDELLEQYGTMKGRYQEVSERYNKIMEAAKPKP